MRYMLRLLTFTAVFAFVSLSYAQQLLTRFPSSDGKVMAMVAKGDTLYMGGNFARFYTPDSSGTYGVRVLPYGGVNGKWPKPNASVARVIPDGADGFFIAGAFTMVGDSVRSGIAHIDNTGKVTAKLSGIAPNNTVLALAVQRDTLFIGGDFSAVNGQARLRVAAIALNSNTLTSWNPGVNGTVVTLAVADTLVFAGGTFSNAGGQTRLCVAAFGMRSGAVTSWTADANSPVFSIAVTATTVYVGGMFTLIKGQPLNRIAAIDIATGNLKTWNPNANDMVITVLAVGTRVYAGGNFSSIGGQTRSRLACIDDLGNATSWNPGADNTVYDLDFLNGKVYAAGQFNNAGGQARKYFAELDTTTGNAGPMSVKMNGTIVYNVASGAGGFFIGGDFTVIGGELRSNLAAMNNKTGALLTWNPSADYPVHTMVVSGNDVYIGGEFTVVNGVSRSRIALINGVTGTAVSGWNPGANAAVRALLLSGSELYAAGDFQVIGGQTRNYLAVLSASTGTITSAWHPNVNGSVNTIAKAGSSIYFGGSFSSVGGNSRSNIAAVDATTGFTTSWAPGANNTVRSIIINGNDVIVGGSFSTLGANSKNNLGMIDLFTGTLKTSWDPNPTGGSVETMTLSGNRLYVGGFFNTAGGKARTYLASLDAATGSATPWNPAPGTNVTSIAVADQTVFAGGDFTQIAGKAQSYFAALTADTAFFKTGTVAANLCAGSPVSVPFTIKDTLNFGNVFTAQLSDASGGFGSPLSIGTLTATSSGTIAATIPSSAGAGSGYRIRVVSSNAAFISDDNGSNITINTFSGPATAVTASGPLSFCPGDSVTLKVPSAPSALYQWRKNGADIAGATDSMYTAKASGSYRVVVRNSIGCTDSSAASSVLVYPKPATSPVSGNASVFQNSTEAYNVSGTPGSTFTWIINGGTQTSGGTTAFVNIKWTVPGTGSIAVIENGINGCRGDTVTKAITITIPDSLILGMDTLKAGFSAATHKVAVFSNRTWTITNPVSWITTGTGGTGNDSISLSLTANLTGTIRYGTITVTAGTVSRTLVVEQDFFVSVKEGVEVFPKLSVYPNPSAGLVIVEGVESGVADLFDALGKKVGTHELNGKAVMDCSGLPAGIYMLRVRNNEGERKVPLLIGR